jgi:sugar phosphate isomerase/epimerase
MMTASALGQKAYFSGINLTFPSLSFEKSLKLIKLLDFEKTDIALIAETHTKHLCTYKELENPLENGKKLLECLQAHALVQTDLFVFLGDTYKAALNNPDIAIREKSSDMFRRSVDYAVSCGCKHITVLPGAVFNDDYGSSLKRATEELTWRVDYAAQKGITLSVEAHIGSVADTPQRAVELLTKTKGLTLTLDYSHFIKNGAAQAEIDPLLQFASHMHLRNAAKGASQTVFQESGIDWLQVIRKIKQFKYSGALTLEFCSQSWENQNRIDTIGETVFLRDYLTENWDTSQ